MKKIFITYGDDAFKNSRKRIAIEARDLGIFDKVIVYTPKDLPLPVRSSPLMAYKRGGGIGAGSHILSGQRFKNMGMMQLSSMLMLDVHFVSR